MSWLEGNGYIYDPDGTGPVEEKPGNRGFITFWPIRAEDDNRARFDLGVGLYEKAERVDVAIAVDKTVVRLPHTTDKDAATELAQKLLEAVEHRKELYGEL